MTRYSDLTVFMFPLILFFLAQSMIITIRIYYWYIFLMYYLSSCLSFPAVDNHSKFDLSSKRTLVRNNSWLSFVSFSFFLSFSPCVWTKLQRKKKDRSTSVHMKFVRLKWKTKKSIVCLSVCLSLSFSFTAFFFSHSSSCFFDTYERWTRARREWSCTVQYLYVLLHRHHLQWYEKLGRMTTATKTRTKETHRAVTMALLNAYTSKTNSQQTRVYAHRCIDEQWLGDGTRLSKLAFTSIILAHIIEL